MKLRWLGSGSASLRRQLSYIAAENPAAARRVGRQIRRSVLRVTDFPDSGRTGHVAGTRELVVPGLPYLVVYRVRANSVEILRVLHTATNWRERHEDYNEESPLPKPASKPKQLAATKLKRYFNE